MYIYNYRAFDLYHQPVISLAILGDDRGLEREQIIKLFQIIYEMMTLPNN